MKCLLCSQEPTNINDLTKHYVTFHRVDPGNWLFKNLFECKNEIFRPEKCLRCTDFIATLEEKKIHDFIRHYEDGQVKPFEPKPMDMEQYGLITKYAISAYKHKDEYDFYDTESVVIDFLRNVKNRFVANNGVIIKVGFTIENIQPSPEEIGTPIINSIYCSIEHVNDYVFFSLK